jgi:hypothetical protein
MTNVTVLNDDDPEVRLMYAQRKALASELYAFADALRTFVPLRKAYFDDVMKEIAHYRESLCPCGKPSVPDFTSPKAGPNQMQWGAHLVKMTIFFDNVFRIPPSSQSGKLCVACDSQATFVKLDGDGEPLAFCCDDHVFEARR